MSTHLSRHFEERRLASGLKPSRLAHLAGCMNILKGGNHIRQFELTGDITPALFHKIAAALQIEQATIERLVEEDRREFFEKWLKWVNEPIKPSLVIRIMAAVYCGRAVPAEITTMAEAEAWAGAVAREENKRCCLVWSRRISCWFDNNGKLEGRTEAAPGQPNVPWMKIGGKSFIFGRDLASVSRLDWPRQASAPQRQSET